MTRVPLTLDCPTGVGMSTPSEQTLLHVIKQALDRGYNVRGTVRSAELANKVNSTFADHGYRFSVVIVSDLSKRELYEPAFANTPKPITGVIHVASPFKVMVTDVVGELLDPALRGVIGALEATRQYGSCVRQFVYTSSFVAILDIMQGLRSGYTYSEKDWNPITREQAIQIGALFYADQHQFSFDIWPYLTPIADLENLNVSSAILWQMIDTTEVRPTDFVGFADVRLVATAHLEAFERPEAAGERFLCGQHFDWQSAVDTLRETMPQLRSRLPVGTPGAGKVEDVYRLDGSKAERVLEIKYIPLEVTMKDSFEQFLQA
ncbi:hypothetical protein GGI43DRAFT_427480 [Trichoderma evansii]